MKEQNNNNTKVGWKTFKLVIWIAGVIIAGAFTYISIVDSQTKDNRDDIVDLKVLSATINTKLDSIKETVDKINNGR